MTEMSLDDAVQHKAPVGGGLKKVLYTLQTASKIGLLNASKALSSHNACKACGLGMGGQLGGMTNELGEFPSVCNKSLQAQSTDIQPPIPEAIFHHPMSDLQELTGQELEHLGRLGVPIFKPEHSDRFQPVSWDWAMDHAATKLADAAPDRTFFYSSGRSSNEAGFVFQLLARLFGTNNVSNCSFYCHQATGVGLRNTIGTGTATVRLDDIDRADLFVLVGANPASNHPRLMHKLINLKRRGGKVIVINPMRESGLVRFAAPKMVSSMLKGGDDIADLYLQPGVGRDLALFKALAKTLIKHDCLAGDFLNQYCEGKDELFAHLAKIELADLASISQVAIADIERAAKLYAESERTIFAWGMGMTHHIHGVDNVEWLSNLALLRGMMGKPGAGLLPLRGHSNVQGIGTIGVKPVLPEEVMQRIEREFGVTLPDNQGLDTLASLERAHAGAMQAAVMLGGNLLEATPDTHWTRAAFARINFKLFLTTTLNRGHVFGNDGSESLVLPVCARDEEIEPTTQESMFNYVRMSDGGIQRIASVRPEVSILSELGTRLFAKREKPLPFDFGEFGRHQHVRSAIAKVVPGLEKLADIDQTKQEFHIPGRIKHEPEFATPSGKARLIWSTSEPVIPDDYTLMTFRSEGQFNSIVYETVDTYRNVKHRWVLHLSQQDALELGVNEGERVDVFSPSGEMLGLEVKVSPLPRGSVAAYYPEANVLTTRTSDPRSKTPGFKSVPVKIRKQKLTRVP